MAKSNKQIKPRAAAAIVGVIVLLLAGFWIADDLQPVTLDEQLEFWNIYPKDGMSFQSENMAINGTDYFVYAALSDGTAEDGSDEYVITAGRMKGIRKNQYDIFSYSSVGNAADLVNNTPYSNISVCPQEMIKTSSKYFGSIYYGLIPASCTSLTVNGQPAKLVRQTFAVDGQTADFKLYYCAIEQSRYPKQDEIVYTDGGHTYSAVEEYSYKDGYITSITQID